MTPSLDNLAEYALLDARINLEDAAFIRDQLLIEALDAVRTAKAKALEIEKAYLEMKKEA